MSYKIGDKVRIKSTDWYNENKNKHRIVICGMMPFCGYMSCRCGTIVTISEILEWGYCIEEDYGENGWTDEMIEGLVEEEMSLDKAGQITDFEYGGLAYTLPKGYIFKDEDGNVINATKIVLEKKKKEYPKTLGECRAILGIMSEYGAFHYKTELITTFMSLLICRDAYWKLYGEEMGLGKPWEPDWKNDEQGRYMIMVYENKLHKDRSIVGTNFILVFPTEEMRDAFYENFKELIEICKELL